MKRTILVFLAAMTLLALTACGGGAPAPQEITITMTDFAFTPDSIELVEGQEVTITLVNEGSVEHEILFGKGDANGFTADLFDHDPSKVEASGGEGFHVGSDEEIEEEGYHVEVEPGASGTLTFTVPEGSAGEWVMGCFIDEGAHYAAGMSGTVTITAP